MAISDIFSTSFLFSTGIIIILIGGIFAYVSYRMGEQDHKLNSMIGLISTMAEESRFFRSKITMLQQKIDLTELPNIDKIQYASQMMGGQEELINVSDDDEEDEYEDDEHEDDEHEDDEHEDEDESEGEDESEEEDESEGEDESEDEDNIKILNLSLANDDNHDEITDSLEIEQLSFDEPKEEIKTVHLENPILLEEHQLEEHNVTEENNETKISEEDMSFLKHVSITDLGEEDVSKPDYKKMPINKLREVIVSKGLKFDASKLKKNEILKLLDEE
jgi:hypothetical protein